MFEILTVPSTNILREFKKKWWSQMNQKILIQQELAKN